MKTWMRRARAAIGMGLSWGALWFGAGVLLARVPGFYSDLPFALLFAPLGFASGVIFSGLLATLEHQRRFAPPSPLHSAGWGALSGLLLSGLFVVGAALGGAGLWAEFLLFGPALTAASALCAAGSAVLARRAAKRSDSAER